MIEEIDKFGSEVKIELFTQFQAPTQSEIYLRHRKSSQGVAPQCPLSRILGNGERGPIDDPIAGGSEIVNVKRNPLNPIWPKVEKAKAAISSLKDIYGCRRASNYHRIKRPIAE
jgi:hypothetical protein